MTDERSTNNAQVEEQLQNQLLSDEEKKDIVNNELACIPEKDRSAVEKIAPPADLIIISTHKKKLTSFKRRLAKLDLEFKGLDKKDQHEKNIAFWRETRDYRTQTMEPEIDELKGPLVTTLKVYNGIFNPMIAEYKEVQAKAKVFLDEWNKAELDEKNREENERKARTAKRVEEIKAAGSVFNTDGFYAIGSTEHNIEEVSIGLVQVENMTDELHNQLILKITETKTAIDAAVQAKKEADAKVKQKLLDDQKQVEEDKKKLRDQNARVRNRELKTLGFELNESNKTYLSNGVVFTVQQVEESTIDEWEALITDAEVKIENEKAKKAKQLKVSAREKELDALGMKRNVQGNFTITYKEMIFGIAPESIEDKDADEWDKLVSYAQIAIAEQKQQKHDDDTEALRKQQVTDQRMQQIASYLPFVQESKRTTIGDVTNDEFELLLKDAIAAYDEKVKKDLEKKQSDTAKANADALAKKGEQAMWEDWISRLKAQTVPQFTTMEFKNKSSNLLAIINKG